MKLFLILALSLLLTAPCVHATSAVDCAVDQPPAKNAMCIVGDYEKSKRNKELGKFSRDLVRQGDRFFRNKKYHEAHKAYDLAHDNLPNAYSYLRAGESVFMAFAIATQFEDDDAKPTGSCLSPDRFVGVVDRTMWNEYDVGIELAKILETGPPVSSVMLADAQKKTKCLKSLAGLYRHTKTGCVDMVKLRTCMGLAAKP